MMRVSKYRAFDGSYFGSREEAVGYTKGMDNATVEAIINEMVQLSPYNGISRLLMQRECVVEEVSCYLLWDGMFIETKEKAIKYLEERYAVAIHNLARDLEKKAYVFLSNYLDNKWRLLERIVKIKNDLAEVKDEKEV